MYRRETMFMLVAVTVLFGLFLAACAPAAAPPAPAGDQQAAAKAELEKKQEAGKYSIGPDGWPTGYNPSPKQGSVYRTGSLVQWDHNDPHNTLTGAFWSGIGWAYSGLLLQARGPGIESPTYVLVPDLAERWEQKDEVTLLFHLRKGVKFHNFPPVNGREMTADDVVYSLKRMATPGLTNAFLVSAITDVEAVDRYTVKITLDGPNAAFLNLISHGYVSIVAREHVEQSPGGNLRKQEQPIGTGPFIITKAQTRQGVWAKRNPDFYMKGLPYLEEIVTLDIPDASTRLSAFRTKQIDSGGGTPEQDASLLKQFPELTVTESINPGSGKQFAFKISKAPYNDVRVRQAISKAINRQEIIDTVLFGRGILAQGFIAPSFDWLLSQEELAKAWKQDIEAAKELLGEAGYPTGFSAELTVANYGETYITESELIQDYLKKIGITTTLKIIDRPTYVSKILLGGEGFNDIYLGPIAPTPELDNYLAQYESGTSKNNTGISDPKLDQLIKAQRRELNPEKRKAIFMDIQRYLLEQSYMSLTAGSVSSSLRWPYVKDLYSPPAYSRAQLYRLWIDPDDPSFKGRP